METDNNVTTVEVCLAQYAQTWDRIDFYPCIAGLALDVSDFTYHKFKAEIVEFSCKKPLKHSSAAACIHTIN